jgi:hypothetical protein
MNYRLSDIASALGLSQLDKLSRFIDRRQDLAAKYDAAFAGTSVIPAPEAPAGFGHSYHLYPVRVPNRRAVYDGLREAGVAAQVHYLPIHRHPIYEDKATELPRAEEAYENLMAALRFGGEPLSPELQRQAKTYEALLASQLAELEVQCKEPGATVMLDGNPLLECPGTHARRLRAGRHQVVAQKPGFETDSRAVELQPGKKMTLVLAPKLITAKGQLERRWPRWVPWTVLAGGVVVGGVAVPLYFKAQSDWDAWDGQLTTYCPTGGDPATLDDAQRARLDDLDSTRHRSSALAYTAIGIGAVGIAAGFTLVLLNPPRLVGAPVVQPQVGKDHASLSIVGRW